MVRRMITIPLQMHLTTLTIPFSNLEQVVSGAGVDDVFSGRTVLFVLQVALLTSGLVVIKNSLKLG